jgi:hypothetical protein
MMPIPALEFSHNSESQAPSFYLGAIEAFGVLVTKLESQQAHQMNLKELEDLILVNGFEALRLALQAHVNERAASTTVQGPVIGADRIERTQIHQHTQAKETIFGTILVTRAGYGEPGLASLHPLDASFNLPDDRYSHAVRYRTAEAVTKSSFDEVIAEINKYTGAQLPKRQAEQIVRRSAQDFDQFYAQREVSPDEVRESSPILVLTIDGKGVPMRKADLREATRKAAETRQPHYQHRRSKGEKSGSKRMSTVAAVYTVAPFMRTPEQVVGELHPSERALPVTRPRPEDKRVWASLEHPPEAVISQAFEEARRRDPQREKRWCAVVDGNELQLELLKCAAKDYQVELTIALDLIHVTEYLWDAARAFHAERDPAAEEWVSQRLLEILRGKSSLVAAGMRRSATKLKLAKKQRLPVDKCAAYLLKYRPYLHYDQYLAAGLPIASGVIEGACRYLVKDRMEKTGARWGLESAEAVLRLRALRASGDFDEYWHFHLQKEYERQHVCRYADGIVPELRPNRIANGSHLRLVS